MLMQSPTAPRQIAQSAILLYINLEKDIYPALEESDHGSCVELSVHLYLLMDRPDLDKRDNSSLEVFLQNVLKYFITNEYFNNFLLFQQRPMAGRSCL